MKDGWHILKGYEVHVENNMVMYGIKEDHNGESVTAYPYRCNTTYGGCDNVSGEVKADTFRRSGLYSLQ